MPSDSDDVLVSLSGVQKDYHGLRPLRVQRLLVRRGHSTAILGLDQAMAEVLVNLITGASVPDVGEVSAFGHRTSEITSGDAWLEWLDRFGLVSERAVVLDQMTVEQNLAVPLSLELFDLPEGVAARVARLAEETGIESSALRRPLGEVPAAIRTRVRLGRALALDPLVLLAEHPQASLSGHEVSSFATDFARATSARRIAALVLTADSAFAKAVASEVLTLNPATGELRPPAGWRQWFS